MILAILLLGLILRLIGLGQSLWLDEAININAASSLDFKTLLFSYSIGDFHPPLFHFILKSWIIIFGNSELAARSPSVLFGLGTIFITYLIGAKLFDKKTGIIASILIATSPLAIYYSQESRMYMLATFLCSLSVFFFISILTNDRLISWIGFVISTTLLLYSDYLPYLVILCYIVFIVILRKKIKKSVKNGFFPALISIFILLSPWLFFLFPKQLLTGLSASSASPAWTKVVGASDFKNLLITPVKFTIGRISIDNNTLYILAFAPIALFVISLFLISLFRLSVNRSFLFLWFFLPIAVGFLLSFLIPVYSYFRFVFLLPAFYLILSSAINTINYKNLNRILFFSAILINLISTSIYLLNPKFQREDWRHAVKYIGSQSSQKTLVLFESSSSIAPFDYYSQNKLNSVGALDGFLASESNVSQKLSKLTSEYDKIFLFQYLGEITDPQGLVFRELNDLNFQNTQTKDFSGVGFVYTFQKK